jgi:hypothetical protein
VLEAFYQEGAPDFEAETDADGDDASLPGHRERVLFIHGAGVRSAMTAAVQDRWDARVYSYDDREDLVRQVRLFIRDIARREQHGDLPDTDTERS